MINAKTNKVYFVNEKTKSFFDKLKNGTSKEKQLYFLIDLTINDLERDPKRYIAVPKTI